LNALSRLILTSVALILATCPTHRPAAGFQVDSRDAMSAPDFSRATPCPVIRVIDGDTVVLALDGRETTIRLIGVDSPETVHPTRTVERFGREAAGFLRNLIRGRSVYIEYEPAARRLDRYGRTLAYLYTVPDARLVNLEIVARGYGHAYTKYPFSRMERFREAERHAREAKLGLWGPAPEPGLDKADGTVYVTKTGVKYHREGCRYLSHGSKPLPLNEAAMMYGPCSRCSPKEPPRASRPAGRTVSSVHHQFWPGPERLPRHQPRGMQPPDGAREVFTR
jgi:micrococcal nuclease